jgi:hypothetical protein
LASSSDDVEPQAAASTALATTAIHERPARITECLQSMNRWRRRACAVLSKNERGL